MREAKGANTIQNPHTVERSAYRCVRLKREWHSDDGRSIEKKTQHTSQSKWTDLGMHRLKKFLK